MSSSLINDRNKKNIRPNISVRLEMYKLYPSIYDTTLWSWYVSAFNYSISEGKQHSKPADLLLSCL